MRTTIELPDALFRELKMVAVHRGISMKALIRISVEKEMGKAEVKPARKVTFPLLPSSEPGSLDLSNADLELLLA